LPEVVLNSSVFCAGNGLENLARTELGDCGAAVAACGLVLRTIFDILPALKGGDSHYRKAMPGLD
jgi:hypothetical protein